MSVQLEMQRTVREKYQIILRAHFHAVLPEGYPRIEAFYRKTAQLCMEWAEKEYGAGLLAEYGRLETLRERSNFGVHRIQFTVRAVWEDAHLLAVLTERKVKGTHLLPKDLYYLNAAVWNKAEQTVLPAKQVQRYFQLRGVNRKCGFAPDGLYPNEEGAPVCYKNATASSPFRACILDRSEEVRIFP